MGETTNAGGEQFSGHDKGRGVGTEVEEELETGNQHSTPASSPEQSKLTWAMVKQTNFPAVPR